MINEKYFRDNSVGCLLSKLQEFRKIPETTESRHAWYSFLMGKEITQKPIPESDYPELYKKYGEFISRIDLCKNEVEDILPERLYLPTFNGIFAILRSSWETQGGQISSFQMSLQSHFTGLEFIAERTSKEKGFTTLIDDEQISEFKTILTEFRENIFSNDLPADLQIRLMRCASCAERAIDDYLDRGINSFQEALESVWKEVIFYMFDQNGNSDLTKKDKINKTGVFQIITELSKCANIVIIVEKLITAVEPTLKLISTTP